MTGGELSAGALTGKVSRISRIMTIVCVTSGHFLEMFDFILFG